jgi:chemotaxis protein MotB
MDDDNSKPQHPIIIKRFKKTKHVFHGGGWKVAFADFSTAMMAFFLLLWLLGNTSDAEKQAISGYFQDPLGSAQLSSGGNIHLIGEGGANDTVITLIPPIPTPLKNKVNERMLNPEKESLEESLRLAEEEEFKSLKRLEIQLKNLVNDSADFKMYKEHIVIDIINSGLRIQILDKEKRAMFTRASAKLHPYTIKILQSLADVLQNVSNPLSITGHTDATPFMSQSSIEDTYGNWELSSDRANAARRVLNHSGIASNKIARVVGFSSSLLFDPKHPKAAINRRIAIIVLKRRMLKRIQREALGG